jgi:hypothetical protein
MVHKGLQRNVVGEDCLRRYTSTITSCSMCRGWVELGQKETRLGATGIANDESGQRETIRDKFLCEC